MTIKDYIETYFEETQKIVGSIDKDEIEKGVRILKEVRKNNGRLFILGVGGGAGHASHAVNDFRKIANIESYTPADNVSEMTAWINDVGWDVVFEKWLLTSRLNKNDALLIFSVGGGSEHTSKNIVKAVDLAKQTGAKIIAVVSRDGGYSGRNADSKILIPVVAENRITPHCEGWQSVIWHILVNAVVDAGE
jgi:D-sedoheptulose 7-phosphate isomerase